MTGNPDFPADCACDPCIGHCHCDDCYRCDPEDGCLDDNEGDEWDQDFEPGGPA